MNTGWWGCKDEDHLASFGRPGSGMAVYFGNFGTPSPPCRPHLNRQISKYLDEHKEKFKPGTVFMLPPSQYAEAEPGQEPKEPPDHWERDECEGDHDRMRRDDARERARDMNAEFSRGKIA